MQDSVFSRLKGCTERLGGALCVLRSHCDLRCSAIGFAIVIITILYVALNALDMLAITTVHVASLLFHDGSSFQNGRFFLMIDYIKPVI
jgi:hypothetical protein